MDKRCGKLNILNQKKKTIIFAGYFTIGEKVQKVQLDAVEQAKRLRGDIAVIANDIDLLRKVRFYNAGGKKLLLRHYKDRIKCGSEQLRSTMPDPQGISNRIDWRFYRNTAAFLLKADQGSAQKMLNDNVVPFAIARRLKAYGLDASRVVCITERELRNRASSRIASAKQNNRKGWRNQFEEAGILSDVRAARSTVPICGGILLAQFEMTALAGYGQVIHVDSKEESPAIENGIRLIKVLHKFFPNDPRWDLTFESIYL